MGSEILEAFVLKKPKGFVRVQCLCKASLRVKIKGERYFASCPCCGARFSVSPSGVVCFQEKGKKKQRKEEGSSLYRASKRLLKKIHKEEKKLLLTSKKLEHLESDLASKWKRFNRLKQRRNFLTWVALCWVLLPVFLATLFLASSLSQKGRTNEGFWEKELQEKGERIQQAVFLKAR